MPQTEMTSRAFSHTLADPKLALHRLLNGILPAVMAAQGVWTRDAYQRLLLAYRRDFLRQRRAYPQGVSYRLLDAQQVTPHSRAYRLQAPVGVHHEGGDTLMLHWANADVEVQQLIAASAWDAHQPVRLRSASSAFNPGFIVAADLATVLREHIDFRVAAPALSTRFGNAAALPLSLTSLLQERSIRIDIDDILNLQPRIEPRSYSISAIERTMRGDIVEVLVSDISDSVASADGSTQQLAGRCGGYLAGLRVGERVRGWPLAFPLTLDHTSAGTRPLLVVATGIAAAGPLCEWQMLALRRPLWLICGVRRFDDGQYLQRLLNCAAANPAMRMDMALSREAAPITDTPSNCHWHGHHRVYQVLQSHHDLFHQHFEAGGDTVVVGHTGMGATIRQWLTQFFVSSGRAADSASARSLLEKLESTLRVQYSLSGNAEAVHGA